MFQWYSQKCPNVGPVHLYSSGYWIKSKHACKLEFEACLCTFSIHTPKSFSQEEQSLKSLLLYVHHSCMVRFCSFYLHHKSEQTSSEKRENFCTQLMWKIFTRPVNFLASKHGRIPFNDFNFRLLTQSFRLL